MAQIETLSSGAMKLTLEIEGSEPSQREKEHSHGTCRYLGEDNMGHMGLTLWALTPPFKLKVEAEDLKH